MAVEDKIIGVESGGDPNARNPNSSAGGAGQFIDSTWLAMLGKYRPDLTGSRDDLLALKSDPSLSRDMTAAYAAENGGILKQAGLPVTPGTTYLAHFAGPGGAVGLLNADPATPASAVLGPAVVKANPFIAHMTAGDVAAWANKKMGGADAAPLSMAGPTRSVAPAAPMQLAPQAQPSKPLTLPTLAGGGGASIAQLAAVPALQNILPPRPNLLGRPPLAPFSLRG